MANWEMIGQEWAVEMLQQHIRSGQVRHAYLLCGPQSVGRRTLALRFAQALNCPQPLEAGLPCGTCRTCRQIEAMQQADLHVVQAEIEGGVLKVENIRDLQHALTLTPYESNYRVALLLRFEEANESTQNALLKTLEEPNPRVVILATAENAEKLLPTIVSRCEVLRLRPTAPAVLAAALQERGVEAQEADLLAHVAGGRPGAALHMHADPTLLEKRRQYIQDLLDLEHSPLRDRFAYAERVTKYKDGEREGTKEDLRGQLETWLSFWRDVLLIATAAQVPLGNPDYGEQTRALAAKLGVRESKRKVLAHQQALERLYFANLRLLMEIVLL
jgi:DNA polymerase-3 subunit delta'